MARAGVTRAAVLARCEEFVDERGLEGLSLAEVAASLGIRQPSLYKHVAGQADVVREISARARHALAGELAAAAVGRSRDDAVRAVAVAYRRWALAHPGRYSATVRAPDPDDAAGIRASAEVVDVVLAVLAGYGLRGDDAIDATRALRAGLHGFASIELAGGFGLPQDRDHSYTRLVDLLIAGLSAAASPG